MPRQAASTLLAVRGLNLGHGDRQLLRNVNIELRVGEILVLAGPAGAGKSVLLKVIHSQGHLPRPWWFSGQLTGAQLTSALEGRDERIPALQRLDEYLGGGREDGDTRAFVLDAFGLQQRVEEGTLMADLDPLAARLAAVARGLLQRPQLLLLDEPTAGLPEGPLRQFAQALARVRHLATMVVATGSRAAAAFLGDRIVMMRAGQVSEPLAVHQMLQFVPDSDWPFANAIMQLDDRGAQTAVGIAPPGARSSTQGLVIRWVVPGLLGGSQRPGLSGPLMPDLAVVEAAGIQHLIGLEEVLSVDTGALRERGVRYWHFPMSDVEAPTIARLIRILSVLGQILNRREPALVHCRLGLGRTGTVLAAYLMAAERLSVGAALSHLQSVHPQFVENPVQLEFLQDFDSFLRAGVKPFSATFP